MKTMKNESGFTLAELMATIIVLGIVAAIAFPIVTDVINSSKEEAYLASMKELIKAGEMYYADLGYKDKSCIDVNDEEFAYDNHGETITGEVCFEEGQVYLKDILFKNFIYNGTIKTLSYVKYEEIVDVGPKPVYTLENQYFDGVDDYIDTGYTLFDESKDFTLIVSVTSNSTASSSVPPTIFHCMNEVSPYPGLVLDQMHASGRLSGAIGANNIFSQAMQDAKNILVVKRDTTAKSFSYYIFNSSGEVYTKTTTVNSVTAFDKSLIIGAYQKTDGTKGRFLKGTINYFALYMEALEASYIEEIMAGLK